MASPLTPGWQQFYQSAQQQNVIDPAVVTAIAINESGWSANGGQSGPINLGIDSTGTPGLPGTAGGIGNATHRFYTYSSGLEAAEGLAAYLSTKLYSGTNVLGMGPERMLNTMVQKRYSGCPGPECDSSWDFKILQLRTQVIDAFGAPSTNGSSTVLGVIPVGPDPNAGANPAPLTQQEQGITSAIGSGLGGVLDSANHILGNLRTPGFWWTIGLAGAAMVAILIGALIIVRPELPMRLARA